ncbi:MAG: DUF58 domain-containing protein [Dermatophilaceae bacterium]
MSDLRRSLTSRGAAFAGSGFVLVAAGVLLGQPDVTRGGVLLLALVVLALVLVRRHGLRLEVRRTASPARVQVDERSIVTVEIRNAESSVSPVLLAEESIDYALGDRPRFVIPALWPGGSQAMDYGVRSHSRGAHRLGPLSVRVRDPFGLAQRAAAAAGDTELVVLPQVVPLSTGRSLGNGIGADGSIPHMVSLNGEDDQTVREYRDGDDLRRIHWPASARTGDLMVRQEDRPAKRRAVLLLDTRRSAHGGSGRHGSLEWSVTMAASVLTHIVDAGYTAHLLTPDAGAHHDDDLDHALDSLARVDYSDDDGVGAVLHAASGLTAGGGLVAYVGGPLSDDDALALAALRQPGSTAVALVVEPATFGARPAAVHPAEPAGATVAVLRNSGWSAVAVDGHTSPAAAWSAVVGGRRTDSDLAGTR